MAQGQDRYFTPPKVPKIDLHVISLHGGGACPSQYWGHTPDGREVYVRYRGGNLTIDIAASPGEEAGLRGGILNVRLGPPLDGTLSAEQLIALTGLRVDDRLPGFEFGPERDLSGATTFWRDPGISATKDGAIAFLAELWDTFPDCEVREISFSEAQELDVRQLAIGEVPGEPGLEIVLGPGCPTVHLGFSLFKFDFRGFGGPGEDARLSESAGRAVETVGSRDCELKYLYLMLSSKFKTGDARARGWLERLDERIDTAFPVTTYAPHDLATGAAVSAQPFVSQDDPRIARWVAGSSGRYRYVGPDLLGGPTMGFR